MWYSSYIGHAFQSTLPARGATRRVVQLVHRPRISIHAPRTGERRTRFMWAMQFSPFQSTLPARGATCATSTCPQISQFQSTLPARERRPVCDRVWALPDISIHAPRTGSDLRSAGRRPLLDLFSIHAPRTGSDSVILNEVGQILISIHAPRTGERQNVLFFASIS